MTEAKNGRDGRGRFVAGNKAGKGKGRPRAEYATAFMRVISPDEWDKIIQAAATDAATPGGHQSRVWLADRIIGRVPSVFRLLGPDVVLLEQLLAAFDRNGIAASDVFNSMLAQFAEQEAARHDENG